MEITKSFAKTYTTRDIYFENKEENNEEIEAFLSQFNEAERLVKNIER